MATDPVTILNEPADPPAGDPPANPPVASEPPANDPPANDPPADDWRTRRATVDGAVDDKLLGYLGRYHSEAAYDKASKQIHDDIRNGKYIRPLGENASDEEKAAWNKLLGVPEKPEGYLEALPDGLVVGDDDKPFVDQFAAKMHEVGAPKESVSAALQVYYDIVADQEAELAENDNAARQTGDDLLRDEWGPDYRRNINVLKSHLDTLPETVKDAILTGRDGNGLRLANNPELLKWLTAQALEANPLATVVPGAGANQANAIADEIADIEKQMGNPNSDYWKGPKAERLQARYRELVTAREKIK